LAGGAGLQLGEPPLTDDLRAKQLVVQARVNDGLNTVTTGVGLTAPTDIVRFPQWFMARGSPVGIDDRSGVAYWPGVANMQVWNNHLLIPEPFGPRNAAGTDAIKAAIQANLPAGLTAHYIDCWRNYHIAYGEVHCGSQVRRTPPAGMLNWWNDWPVADDQ
jgi:protein-arginine deiminase